jgi:hypothetical protein
VCRVLAGADGESEDEGGEGCCEEVHFDGGWLLIVPLLVADDCE